MKNIPKQVFFYWGGETLPFLRYMTLYSFRKHNPSWKIILCVPRREDISKNYNWPGKENKNDLSGKDYFSQAQELVNEVRIVNMELYDLSNSLPEVTKSDYYRLYLLANHFGLWLDMDIIFFRPMEHAFLQTDHKAYICYQKDIPTGKPYHSIGLLMSAPDNTTWAHMQYYAQQHIHDYDYQAIGSPFYEKYLDETALEVCNFSNNIVYPIRWPNKIWERPAEISLTELKLETIGIHFYVGHPTSAKYQALLTDENYMNYDNIVCYYLKKALS